MKFKDGNIEGVRVDALRFFNDHRGWLTELYREDELPGELLPVMSYISMTLPGIARGPHAHADQTDCFALISSKFQLFLWDARPESPTYQNRMLLTPGADNPIRVFIPPMVVHAYKNIGTKPGLVLNFPNRLFAGRGKSEKVDEIRYEEDPASPYRLEP